MSASPRPSEALAPAALAVAALTALTALAVAPRAGAQSLAERIPRTGSAVVRFDYAVRDGVCGDGRRGIAIVEADGTSQFEDFGARTRSSDGTWDTPPCAPGPARVSLAVEQGVPRTLQLAVGGRRPADEPSASTRVVDLGTVPAPVAAAYLLELAGRADAPSPTRALLGAIIADDVVVWPQLLRLARDERLPRATQREAARWTGRAACTAVTTGRAAVTPADTADRATRRQVVFALSQRPSEEHVPALTRVARTDRDPAVRCSALFWLGEGARGGGPEARVLGLYEELLRAAGSTRR